MDKLYYKLTLYSGCNIQFLFENIIVFEYEHNDIENMIITIWKKNKLFYIYLNGNEMTYISNYDNIVLYTTNKEKYEISINYPLSINGFTKSHFENWNNIASTFSIINDKYQINIQHLDSLKTTNIENMKALDKKIINLNCNYIFVDKTHSCYFNLGYCRNLYKYLSWSDNIVFSDIDIYVPHDILTNIYNKTVEGYDVVKPYKNIIYTTPEQKQEWLKTTINDDNYSNFISNINDNLNKKCFSVSGGIVLIKKYILELIGGFNEINGYGFEDRFMDIHLLHHETKTYIYDYKLFHLYHDQPKQKIISKTILKYNTKYYNCFHDSNNKNSIHEHCEHITQFLPLIESFHKETNGNLVLFKQKSNIYKYATLKKLPF